MAPMVCPLGVGPEFRPARWSMRERFYACPERFAQMTVRNPGIQKGTISRPKSHASFVMFSHLHVTVRKTHVDPCTHTR